MKYLILMLLSVNFLYAEEKEEKEYRVAIFGTNYLLEETSKGFDDPLLARIFKVIRAQNPDAVFFTGDMLLSLEHEKPISLSSFKKQLDVFSQMKDTYLGTNIPLYPTLGNNLPTTYEIIETFRQHFDIQKISPRPPYHLAYTVPIDGSEFIVLATGFDEPDSQAMSVIGTKPRIPILDWLDKYLSTNSGSFQYRFILSHLPAFSSTAASGTYLGLDKNPFTRDIFWSILRKNHVNAYLSSFEPIYDRSNRDGIWQVISGGFLQPERMRPETKTFSHFLLLVWGGEYEVPILKVIDLDGREWDTFRVTPLNFPVHQMRISDKYN